MKLNYFLKNHSHCDGDREIGNGGIAIANKPVPTFEVFKNLLNDTYANHKQSFISVERFATKPLNKLCMAILFNLIRII